MLPPLRLTSAASPMAAGLALARYQGGRAFSRFEGCGGLFLAFRVVFLRDISPELSRSRSEHNVLTGCRVCRRSKHNVSVVCGVRRHSKHNVLTGCRVRRRSKQNVSGVCGVCRWSKHNVWDACRINTREKQNVLDACRGCSRQKINVPGTCGSGGQGAGIAGTARRQHAVVPHGGGGCGWRAGSVERSCGCRGAVTSPQVARGPFPSIGSGPHCFFQGLEEVSVSFANAWKLCFFLARLAVPFSCFPHAFDRRMS